LSSLNQIADWLTKIIVGVSLVNAIMSRRWSRRAREVKHGGVEALS
jgi:hypothetical protein